LPGRTPSVISAEMYPALVPKTVIPSSWAARHKAP
jgi:hypothetical protein